MLFLKCMLSFSIQTHDILLTSVIFKTNDIIKSTSADSGGAAPPNSWIRLRAIAGHSWSQCSSVSGAPWQCGQVAEESASTMFRYAASLW